MTLRPTSRAAGQLALLLLLLPLLGPAAALAATTTVSGTLPATNATVKVDTGDATMFSATVTGAFTGTITFQVLYDSTEDWVAAPCFTRAGASATNTLTAPGSRFISTAGAVSLRAIMNPYTTGTPEVTFAGGGGNPATAAGTTTVGGTVTANQGTPNAAGANGWPVQGSVSAGSAASGASPLVFAGQNSLLNVSIPSTLLGNSDGNTVGFNGLVASSFQELYNGTSWDRQRSSQDVSLHASAATGTGTVNTDLTTYNYKFLVIHANVTNYNAGNVTLKVQMQDANGVFADIPTATTGAVSTGADIFLTVGPSSWPANASPVFYANQVLPRTIRIVQTVAAATVTFSAAYTLKN